MGGEDGLFGPRTVTWRVNREGALLIAGGRALLMQVAHPLVAAGVVQHSSFESDPWRRLRRTLSLTTRIVFDDDEGSARAAATLRAVHARVSGTAPDGRPFRALDPDLLLWVWATLVDSAVLAYGECVGPLSHAERERYYAEQGRFAAACGVPEGHWPATWPAFGAYVDAVVRDVCVVGDDAHRIARGVVRPGLGPINLLTVGLLGPRLRAAYGFPWSTRREQALRATLSAVRAGRSALPERAREFPAAYAASRRVRPARA
ncbi:MAG: hypothetical protein QOC78_3545 [Solirubrobacteraceae bacterium]|jgi:uncharacterized protein (DUF2236 family)|nr:hypothetical protein [Solirubrobacteraceae bacterium]